MATFGMRLFNLKCRTNIRFVSTKVKVGKKNRDPPNINELENLMINQVLKNNEKTDVEKWTKIREELLTSGLSLNKYNVDAKIINRCVTENKFDVSVNYVEYLISTNQKINLGVVNKFLHAVSRVKRPLSEKEMNLIFKIYDDVRAEYPVLDPATASTCILALCRTARWKEYKELRHMAGLNQNRIPTYESISAAAFNHDEPDEGWEMAEAIAMRGYITQKFCDSYLNYCSRHSKDKDEIESHLNILFHYLADRVIYPTAESVMKLGDYLEKLGGWSSNKARLDGAGYCVVCSKRLETIQITTEEFELLQKAFFFKVFVGNDVYHNTTPQEMEHFQEYVERTKPYDVVIDGLNVAHLIQASNKAYQARNLMMVVRAFAKEGKKIFVLGRKHMSQWRSQEMDYVRQHAHLYLANDLSEDDTFLIHATLSSGIQTYFCSRDFMREHKSTLANDNLKRIFHSWQMSRQIFPTSVGGIHNSQFLLVQPSKIETTAQMRPDGSWHIPYRENDPHAQMISPLWLCLRKTKI